MSLGKSLTGIAVELGVIKGQTLKIENDPGSEKNEYRIKGFKSRKFGRNKQIYSLILAVTAVSFSIIYDEIKFLDNEEKVSDSEEADINHYIEKLQDKLSNRKLVKKILEMKKNQIDFVGALNYAAKVQTEDWGIFENLLDIISNTDDNFSKDKTDFVRNLIIPEENI